MNRPNMRPTFELPIHDSPEVIFTSLRRSMQSERPDFLVQSSGPFADVQVPLKDKHFFSPMLHLEIREEDPQTIHGRFSPHPDVWTAFMALYGLLAIAGTAGAMYGISQWILHRPPWTLIATPVSILLIGFVYGATFIGQGLGAEQMYLLRSLVDHGLEKIPPASNDESSPRKAAENITDNATQG